jgi:hypothetical protein
MIQEILVGICLVLAGAYLVRSFLRSRQGASRCASCHIDCPLVGKDWAKHRSEPEGQKRSVSDN